MKKKIIMTGMLVMAGIFVMTGCSVTETPEKEDVDILYEVTEDVDKELSEDNEVLDNEEKVSLLEQLQYLENSNLNYEETTNNDHAISYTFEDDELEFRSTYAKRYNPKPSGSKLYQVGLSLEIPMRNIEHPTYQEELVIGMEAFGLSNSQQEAILQGVEDVQNKEFRQKNEQIMEDLKEYDSFEYEVVDDDENQLVVSIKVWNVGDPEHEEEIDIMIFKHDMR